MTLAILPSLDLVVNKTVTVVAVAGTATTRVTLGNIVPSETVVRTGQVGTYRSVTTSSLYLAGTQAVLGPRETLVNTTSNVGVAQKFTTPALGTTITTRQNAFIYGSRLAQVTDVNYQSLATGSLQSTNLFANNRVYGGFANDRITAAVLDPFISTTAGNVFFNNLNHDYGTIVSNVAAIASQPYTSPGTYTFTVPAGVTSLSLVTIGGGGGGAQNTTAPSGGSGGLLTYANSIVVTPGETFTVVIGTGGTSGTTMGNSGAPTYIYRNSNNSLVLQAFGGAGGNGLYWNETVSSVSVFDTPQSSPFYLFQATSPTKETITYSATGLPNGVTIGASTGVLSGDPDTVSAVTNYPLTVTASTATQSISRQFVLTVLPISQIGQTAATGAPSIASLRANGVTTDGVYWFSTNKQVTPFQAYVRFNYIDGGDWALLLKVHNQGDMPSGSPFWTNTTLQNSTDWNLTSGFWSKYATWNGIEFTRLMMVMTQGGVAKIPPIMVFNASRTFAEAIALAGGANAANGQNNIVKATSTDPVRGTSVSYWNVPMKSGTAFTDAAGVEDFMQAYGIAMWANNASNSTTAEGLPSVGRAGAWIGCPMDDAGHAFNNDSNTGADSGFGFGFAAGNPAKTGSAGYAEWTNSASTNTLPGYVWVR